MKVLAISILLSTLGFGLLVPIDSHLASDKESKQRLLGPHDEEDDDHKDHGPAGAHDDDHDDDHDHDHDHDHGVENVVGPDYVPYPWETNPPLDVAAAAAPPEIIDITATTPVDEGDSIFLNAICQGGAGGDAALPIRMAGIGNNGGTMAFNSVFESGDREGSMDRITAEEYNALTVPQLRENYDVLLFTWASSTSVDADWDTRIKPYIDMGGSVFWEDEQNIGDLAAEVDGSEFNGSFGDEYGIISQEGTPNEVLTDNGVIGSFVNHHIRLNTVDPSWTTYITDPTGDIPLAIFKVFESSGRMIVQGPDQDFHAVRMSGNPAGNQYQFILNQLDWLTTSLGTTIEWFSPSGARIGTGSMIEVMDAKVGDSGTYTAVCTQDDGQTGSADIEVVVIGPPSAMPSGVPSSLPSSIPSVAPSSLPSNIPSLSPTRLEPTKEVTSSKKKKYVYRKGPKSSKGMRKKDSESGIVTICPSQTQTLLRHVSHPILLSSSLC